jgi:hypothetical protein
MRFSLITSSHKKKPLELLMLRAQLIGQVHGSLPDYSLLPRRFSLITSSHKKKPLELLMLRAQLIGQVHGSLPDHSLLPKHYILDVVNDHTLCDHCHCGLRIQRTLVRYPVGILLGEPILRHHIKKCQVCGREYQYEQLNDLVPPHGNYAYDIMIENSA